MNILGRMWEMSCVDRYDIISVDSNRAFQKPVVWWVRGSALVSDGEGDRWLDEAAVLPDCGQSISNILRSIGLWVLFGEPGEHIFIFTKGVL